MVKETKSFDIDSDAIRELAALMEETGLTEIEVSEGDKAIRVAKGQTVVSAAPVHHAGHIHAPSATAIEAAPATSGAPTAQTAGAVTSPMVGTAYLRPDPSSGPFVTAGSIVAPGDTLLIIEAMKVMNPIKAAKGGKVVQIVVSDAQPVEFGEVLLVIE